MHSMMLFSTEEYRQRLDRARTLMAEQGVDALLVSAPNNLVYLSGYRTNLFDSNFRPFLALVPADGEPTLILPNLEKGVGEETSWMDDIRAWGPDLGNPLTTGMIAADAVNAATVLIKEKKLDRSRIGIEMGFGQRIGMSVQQLDQLRSLLPEAQWKDSTQLLWRLRALKSGKEIEYLRRASEITDKGYERVLEAAREGVTERELQGVMGATFLQEGGDYRGFIIVSSGKERYKMMNPYASDRALKRGDMCTFDFGAVYNGYWSDLTRSFFVGEPSKRQREFYEVALEASETAVKAAKPGMAWEQVDEVAERFLVDHGYKGNLLHRTGHSIGLEVHEMPSIALGDKNVVEPGMVVAIEPGIYDYEIGGFRVEDICLITDMGAEYLSHCRRELTVV